MHAELWLGLRIGLLLRRTLVTGMLMRESIARVTKYGSTATRWFHDFAPVSVTR